MTMALTTNLAITNPVNAELVFLAARRILEIPGEHPFGIGSIRTDGYIQSEPGGFDAMLTVWFHAGNLPIDVEGDEPVTYVRVSFDTDLRHVSAAGENVEAVHRRLTAAMGAWCDSQGLEWWTAEDGAYGTHGGYRLGMPAYAPA
jgi:hypothetical protein